MLICNDVTVSFEVQGTPPAGAFMLFMNPSQSRTGATTSVLAVTH